MIQIQDEERKALSRYIHASSAIALDESKGYLIEGRLGALVEEMGCRSYGELLARAQSEATGVTRRRIIDAITTGETLFFRDSSPFELLRNKILPELIDRRSRSGGNRPIRIWSAACSSGQEAYSIGIVLKELLGDPYRYGVRLLGTDISDHAVARASRGVYNRVEIERGLSGAALSKYFVQVAEGWRIRDEIRGLASFRTLNLAQDFTSLGRFDLILCRNVAIYFNEQDKTSLFHRIGNTLESDGYLIIGAMESLGNTCPEFESSRHMRSVYYTLKGGGVR